MANATPPPSARTGARVSGYCQLDYGHQYCQPGDVVTSYGDVALTVRCDCPCHREGSR